MDEKAPADRAFAARFAPLFGLPAILAAASAHREDGGWGEPATWWGVLVGVTLALAATGIGYAMARRR